MGKAAVYSLVVALPIAHALPAARAHAQSDTLRERWSGAQRLEAVRVAGRAMCDGALANRDELLRAWDAAKSALASSQALARDTSFHAELVRHTRVVPVASREAEAVSVEAPVWNRGDAFASPAIADLARHGFVRSSDGEQEFVAPDAHQVLSEPFAEHYCLWAARGGSGREAQRGLGFRRAATALEGDVEGTLWLSADGRLRSIRYDYVGLLPAAQAARPGGEIHFLQLPTGRWIVHRWQMRIPELEVRREETGFGVQVSIRHVTRVRRVIETGGWVRRVVEGGGDTLVLPGDTLRLAVVTPGRGRVATPGTIVAGVELPGAWELGRSGVLTVPEAFPGVLRFAVEAGGGLAATRLRDTIEVVVVPHDDGLRATLALPERRAAPREGRATANASTTHAVRVAVQSARDGSMMRDADVRLDGLPMRWVEGDSAYVAYSVASGRHALRVRRIGFTPDERPVEVTADQTRHLVRLHPLATLLPEMIVAGRRVLVDPRFEGVVVRAMSNWGTLITRQDLRSAYDIQSVLETVPGIRFRADGISFARCQDALPGTGTPPKVQVYVDGVRVTTFKETNAIDALQFVSPSAIEVVEVYRGVSRIPVEFLNDACAVIAIWTRPP